ncbi:MAG TPA: CoA-binding protein [Actinobacteria bacterium]|jgi:predicted CoA-binding protein|nr:CoA-binding protein [Actinomycetota bacterium]HCP72477.1 CoA-binding protein [Actinomycetota bacterium]
MSSQDINELLDLKTWAVVGLSNNSERAAYKVAKVLIEKGHTVIPIHPKAETVHGQKGYASLSEVKSSIDVVDIFVNSSLVGPIVDEAILIGAKGVWLQLDVIDDSAILRAKNAGLYTVMNRCPAIEYGKK